MHKMMIAAAAGVLAVAAGCSSASSRAGADSGDLLLFTGSYAPADSAGVKVLSFNQNDGSWETLGAASGVSNPSFVAVDSVRGLLYCVEEESGVNSSVCVLRYSPDGRSLTLLSRDSTGGAAPCHIALSPDRSKVVTANYMGGNVTVYSLDSAGIPAGSPTIIRFSGSGPDSLRQSQPHLHQCVFLPDGMMLANDLGTDSIHYIPAPYTAAAGGVALQPGCGPRHTVLAADGTRAYNISEIGGAVTRFEVEPGGIIPVETLVADTLGAEGASDIHISPDGRFLYVSLRLRGDGIVVYAIDPGSGALTRAGFCPTGPHPRNFAITPNGRYLLVACRDSDTIEVYRRDGATGMPALEKTIPSTRPTCLVFSRKQGG